MTPPQSHQPYGTEPVHDQTPAGTLRVGCAMWAHRAWVGRHLPADVRPGGELAAYATWCLAVEGNTTFYATPPATTVERWRTETPDGFEFCFKVPRTITHERRLRNATDLLREFCDRIAPLGNRLGPIQIQLPPSFSGADLPVLDSFLAQLPSVANRDACWAVEFRHPDLFVGGAHERRADDLLTLHNVNRVILDSRALFDRPPGTEEEHDAWEKKPRLPVRPVAPADRPILRLIGSSDLAASVERWQQWIPTIVRWLGEGRSPLLFTHTPDNVDALPLARRFHDVVADECEAAGQPRPCAPEPLMAGRQLDLLAADRTRNG